MKKSFLLAVLCCISFEAFAGCQVMERKEAGVFMRGYFRGYLQSEDAITCYQEGIMEFYIHETKRTVKAATRPIVIITSNAEKELPDAFLRRCIFHYIAFPDKEEMEEIVKVHFEDLDENLLKYAMSTFYWIRSIKEVRKKPSTSELIDWLQALSVGGIEPETIRQKLPYLGVLVKKDEDLNIVNKNKVM